MLQSVNLQATLANVATGIFSLWWYHPTLAPWIGCPGASRSDRNIIEISWALNIMSRQQICWYDRVIYEERWREFYGIKNRHSYQVFNFNNYAMILPHRHRPYNLHKISLLQLLHIGRHLRHLGDLIWNDFRPSLMQRQNTETISMTQKGKKPNANKDSKCKSSWRKLVGQ